MEDKKYAQYLRTDNIRSALVRHPEMAIEYFSMYPNIDFGREMKFSCYCIDKPLVMIEKGHFHDFEQFLGFSGGNPEHTRDFDAEVELYLGPEQEKYVITSPCYFYVPAGLIHGPLIYRRIGRPILFFDIALTSNYVRKQQS